jgi:hypothetical protein
LQNALHFATALFSQFRPDGIHCIVSNIRCTKSIGKIGA